MTPRAIIYFCVLPLSVAPLTAVSAPASAAGRSIVGQWAPDPRQCLPFAGAIAIGPLSIVGDDFRCDFKSVSRAGEAVTWQGRCGFPEPAKPATVVAISRGETLTLKFNGGDGGSFRRCRGRFAI